ncbi:MAG: hypothetical protein ABIR59_03530 [Gemmatimonadales bacterium]
MRLNGMTLLTVLAVGACASTTGPVALPLEVLVVLDRDARTLTVVPLDSIATTGTINLPMAPATVPTTLAVRGAVAAVGYGNDSVMIVDLVQRTVLRRIGLSAAGPVAALMFSTDGRGYAASPRANRVTAFDPPTGEIFATTVSGGPQAFGLARGTIFVVLGNRQGCYPPPIPGLCGTGPSWLNPLEGSPPYDSIPLPGPGNASAAVSAPDGLLYVLSSGDGTTAGRLSIVDPVIRQEIAAFSGFGVAPRFLASDGERRLLIASDAEGLMVFDFRDRRIVRGTGQGVPLDRPAGLLSDAIGNIYVLESGPCTGGTSPRVRVFGSDLVSRRDIATSSCPVAMALTEIPAELLGSDR